jgi:hypothetical protein
LGRSPNESRLALVALVCSLIAACAIGENTHETVVVATPTVPETRTCDSPFVVVDLDTLEPCGNGMGHCYDASKTSIHSQDVPACKKAGEICVPDKTLLAGGKKPKSCQFLGGKLKGACSSLLLAELAKHKDEVTQENCDADERCTPCDDPRTGENTGTCDPDGVHEKACVGGPEGQAGETCCHASGVCMDREAVPADSRDDLDRDSCSKSNQLCAPLAMSDGVPQKCSLLGVDGVCIDVCFASMLKGVQRPARGECAPTEICLPCVIGKSQGMPGCD